VESLPDAAAIYESNIVTLKRIGESRMKAITAALLDRAATKPGNDA
jgi:hypothetical protein